MYIHTLSCTRASQSIVYDNKVCNKGIKAWGIFIIQGGHKRQIVDTIVILIE